MRAAAVVGLGTALPREVVTNDDLAARLDTSDEWIVARSGIRERRIAGDHESTVTLAAEAAADALTDADVSPDSVDLVVLATTTPVSRLPGDASRLQHALGLSCGGFDVDAACAGFVHALTTGLAHVMVGVADVALVVGTETLSRIVDHEDRGTAVLFGDGAGAAVVVSAGRTHAETAILGWDAGCDGSAESLLEISPGGQHLRMDGPEVFRRAVRAMSESSSAALCAAGLRPTDVDVFVPHQANARIITATAERLGVPPERTMSTVATTGNTSAASIPLALRRAADEGRLDSGGVVLLTAVGAGLSWASLLLRWGRR